MVDVINKVSAITTLDKRFSNKPVNEVMLRAQLDAPIP